MIPRLYQQALTWAQKVQSSGIDTHNPSYSQLFINEAQENYDTQHREILWEAEFTGNATGINLEEGWIGNTNGIAYSAANFADSGYSYGYINATQKQYDLYGGQDLRRDRAIAPYGYEGVNRVDKGTLIYDRNCGKRRRTDGTLVAKNKNLTNINFPIIRYVDVLLMIAEAENQVNGPTDVAYHAINEVRRRGYGLSPAIPSPLADLPPGLSKGDFQLAVEDERARELCLEGTRRPDLVRWVIWTTTMRDEAAQIDRDLDGNASWSYASLGATNASSSRRDVLFPIPTAEITVNKAATQNSGY